MDDKNILELHVEQQDTGGTAKRAAEYHKRLIHQTSIVSEKEYQKFLLERLEKDNGFVVRKATNFDRYYAVDREMLFKFLNDTQPDTMDYLRKIYKDDLEETIVSFINAETTKTRGSLIEVLKHGIELSNQKIELMYTKPATTFNPELTKKYSQNIFSVMEEVWASDKERIDVVIFLNGLAIMAFELKCNAAGQSYQDAIYQFRTDRNPKTRLFRFKAGTLVNFAMDLEEVYMTTKLDGQATFFLPFNMGNGHGVTAGAGNPAFKDKYSVSYMWEDILTKDTILDLISKFIFVEVKEKVDEETGKVKRSENLIFPRYHQLDVIRKILADVRENGTAQNYLIQHSAGSGEDTEADVEDMISSEIKRNGKQANVSMFAFTATPKPTTIQLFGHQNTKGQKEAFHVYSMKQAIEEGFILDVLQNYTEYSTFYQINKEIEDDPRCKTNDAKRQIARFIELHDTNIAQRVEVIVEHFRTTVMQELGGQAKAMVITASRQSAVKYRQAFEDYIAKKGYEGIHALVAFSGKVKLPDDELEYTESSLNGFPEDRLTKEFDTDKYQVLLVANKYQTGFDQPKLCAMYVLKKLKGVNAVQTLSRLNRICAPYDKKTFVLDFVNSYEDIKSAFVPYYTTTLLANSVTPSAVYDLEAKIDAYGILDPADIEAANDILYADKVNGKQKQRLTFFLQKSKKLIEHYEYNTQRQCVADMRSFVRFYEFLLQVSSFEDTDLHKKYNFVSYLLAYINIKHPGGGFNLNGKIKATNFVQKKGEEHKSADLVANPVMKLPTAEHFGLTEDKEKRLSEIIDEINSRTGKNYDNDLVVRAMLQIRDILMKSEKLKTSARNNTQQDFEFSYFDDIDDALIEGLSQNQDFFSMLLSNDEMKRQVLGIFSDEIYKSLRNAK